MKRQGIIALINEMYIWMDIYECCTQKPWTGFFETNVQERFQTQDSGEIAACSIMKKWDSCSFEVCVKVWQSSSRLVVPRPTQWFVLQASSRVSYSMMYSCTITFGTLDVKYLYDMFRTDKTQDQPTVHKHVNQWQTRVSTASWLCRAVSMLVFWDLTLAFNDHVHSYQPLQYTLLSAR